MIKLLGTYWIWLFLLQVFSGSVLIEGQAPTTEAPSVYPGTYLVVAPKTVRPGLPYAVSVNILQTSEPVTVTLKIIDKDNQTLVQQVQQGVKAGTPVTVKIDKVPNSLVEGVTYNVYVKGETSSGKQLFEKSENLNFNSKALSTFIQTDKAIYKPGSTVHFRIVTVYPDLKPYNGIANVKVTDPNRNVLQQFSNISFEGGVIGKNDKTKIILTDEPPLGDWTISCDVNGIKTDKTFTVDKYVLPKFEVTVKPPSFITITDDLAVTVSAKYTYGKGVAGSATLYAEPPYRWSADKQTIIKTAPLDKNGEAIFRMNNAELKEKKFLPEYSYNSITFTATVTESLTDIKRNGTGSVAVHQNRYKLAINKPSETFQPGLDYVISIALTTQDDKPLTAEDKLDRQLNLTIVYTFPYQAPPPNVTVFETTREKSVQHLLTLNQDGTLVHNIQTAPGASYMRIEAVYDSKPRRISESVSVEASKSPTKSYLQITTEKTSVKAGDSIVFNVKTTADVPTVTAQVMTRGYMVFIENVKVSKNLATVTIPTSAEMAPKSRLIIYGVRPDNKEIIVGAMDLKVEGLLRNKVSISVDPKRTEPGKNVTFTIKASPTSYIGLLAVDKSVTLLKSGNDITKEMLESDIAQYDTTGSSWWSGRWGRQKRMICWRCGWWGMGGKDAATIFDNSGVIVLTDAFLFREPPPPMPWRHFGVGIGSGGGGGGFGGMRGVPGPVPDMSPASATNRARLTEVVPAAPVVRTKFPETWLWSDSTSKSNGEATYSIAVPDTITSWITTAFAVHDTDGLGVVPEPAIVEVFRPFFIRLNLPYSVKRGEKLALQVLIFNYMAEQQTVTVTLEHNENSAFDIIPKPGSDKNKEQAKNANVRVINVPGDSGSATVYFPIIPTKVGDLKLLVKAVGQGVGDGVENVLIVEAEGYPIYRNKPFVVDLSSTNTWTKSIPLEFPANIIPGSQKASVTFVGDLMGPILENIEKLIQMPYGCGEQNMLNFVPNIVVTRYLKATSRLTTVLQEKTKRYMEAGYQRELTYQRDDFSYSAFGKGDKAGSTWLTAFVARSFHQAKPFIFVDGEKLAKSLAFLKTQQKENGAFAENGEVHHKAMQGGAAAGGAPLTAYVFLALLENDVKNAEALNFLERSLERMTDDSYALAVITYALHLAGSSKKDDAFKMLEKQARDKDGTKHWSQNVTKSDVKQPSWYERPSPADVEMTSYALLTYLLRGDTQGAVPLVRWLVGQQNAYGGYSSTQDTVMALQALGAYAEKTYSPNVGATLTARNGDQKHTFEVKPENAIVQQFYELKNYDKPVELDGKGRGAGFGQISWHYNLPQLSDDQPFVCDQDVKQSNANEVLVNFCCRYALPGRSNMALMEVEAPSGFLIDQEKLNMLTKVKDLQRVELDRGDSVANVYFNSIGSEKICMNVTSQRAHSVAEQKPSIVKLSDYYSPEKQIRFEYTLAKKMDINEVCGGDCWREDGPGGRGGKVAGSQSKGKAKSKRLKL